MSRSLDCQDRCPTATAKLMDMFGVIARVSCAAHTN
jgi:hypothetical protein